MQNEENLAQTAIEYLLIIAGVIIIVTIIAFFSKSIMLTATQTIDETINLEEEVKVTENKISLYYPNNTTYLTGKIIFAYAPQSPIEINSCKLIVNEKEEEINFSISKNKMNIFEKDANDFPIGNHSWNIECEDSNNALFQGTQKYFTIQEGIVEPEQPIEPPPLLFSGGDGTINNPYQITKIEHLNTIRYYPDKNFILMNDLDFENNSNYNNPIYKNYFITNEGWKSIGITNYCITNIVNLYCKYNSSKTTCENSCDGNYIDGNIFTGNFNGNNHTIKNLYSNKPLHNYIGLFGSTNNSQIKNLIIEDANIIGRDYTGGIIGYANNSIINNISFEGIISGKNYVGGIIGSANNSQINILKNTSNINAQEVVGGIIGQSDQHTIITNTQNIGSINGITDVGGIAGRAPNIQNSLNSGDINGTENIGGIMGQSNSLYTNNIKNTYNIGTINGNTNAGGFAGKLNSTIGITNSGWWTGTTTQSIGTHPDYELTYNEINKTNFYPTEHLIYTNGNEPWDFDNIWLERDNNYPILRIINESETPTPPQQELPPVQFAGGDGTINNPYQITKIEHLNTIRYYPDKNFILMNDLDFENDNDYNNSENKNYFITNEGWSSIGKKTYCETSSTNTICKNNQTTCEFTCNGIWFEENLFTGNFNGNYKKINNLYSNKPLHDYTGLFGSIKNSEIKNLIIEDANIIGRDNTGGIIGDANLAKINNVSFKGIISGKNNVGGITGNISSSNIDNTKNFGKINAQENVGGITGNVKNTSINNAFNTQEINGTTNVGGITGNHSGGLITNVINIGQINGTINVGGIAGRAPNIQNSLNSGDINGTENIGGIMGQSNSLYTNNIKNTYNIGTINGNTNAGGFAGKLNSTIGITNSGWWTGTTTQSIGTHPDYELTYNEINKTNFYPKEHLIYTAQSPIWDFENTWLERDNNYPILKTMNEIERLPQFPNGDGTINNPYQITKVEHLNTIRYYLNSNFVLMNDLDFENNNNYINPENKNDFIFGEGWDPIGKTNYCITSNTTTNCNDWKSVCENTCKGIWIETNLFTGNFNGNNNTIKNLYSNKPQHNYTGLFGSISNSEIKNLIIEDANIIGKEFIGGIIGSTNYSIINNASFEGNISGKNYVGGIIGYANNSDINNTKNYGKINAQDRVGGIIGSVVRSKINNSFNNNKISGANSIGGIIGFSQGATTKYTNVINIGSINGQTNVGGIIGYDYYSEIKNSLNAGDINGTSQIGGITGQTINQTNKIDNSYNIGLITGTEDIGGIIGNIYSTTSLTITNSGWWTGTTTQAIGNNTTIVFSYNETNKTNFYPKEHLIYTNGNEPWDFDNIWLERDNNYPILRIMNE